MKKKKTKPVPFNSTPLASHLLELCSPNKKNVLKFAILFEIDTNIFKLLKTGAFDSSSVNSDWTDFFVKLEDSTAPFAFI